MKQNGRDLNGPVDQNNPQTETDFPNNNNNNNIAQQCQNLKGNEN